MSQRTRHARQTDIPTIRQFILELAEHQNDLAQVTVTEELLAQSLIFDPNTTDHANDNSKTPPTTPSRPARCLLVLAESGIPVGMAIYFYSFVTWHGKPGIYLEDFYVRASERGKGYGRELISALIEELQVVGGVRLEWRVLDWNELGVRFYKGIGATVMNGWMDMKLEPERFKEKA
ncbi:N-acetyltransferase ats1 [Penicillium cosmopolitanum]|uniref:N-acetyltransferase ats1 n=1 Tax=Penicillium cosmopolitanum TaxID=1131564 RepID=A0A9W9W6A6_9EURO|nr:N-acetyltransferase ats1 [Penicillium cosmopolitanum]KAJ5404091.1 N-acetyltransferase ats1 [Penicillium cosmopolitanum]